MNLDDFGDDSEDPKHLPTERAAAGTWSTWDGLGIIGNLAGYPILDPTSAPA